MEYGIIYCQVCLPKTHGLNWLRWCNSPLMLPDLFRTRLVDTIEQINTKWKDEVIIPFDKTTMPTSLTRAGKTEEIANDLHSVLNELLKPYTGEEENIRIVWTEAWLPEVVEQMPSGHQLGTHPAVVRVGKLLESGDETGIFKT